MRRRKTANKAACPLQQKARRFSANSKSTLLPPPQTNESSSSLETIEIFSGRETALCGATAVRNVSRNLFVKWTNGQAAL